MDLHGLIEVVKVDLDILDNSDFGHAHGASAAAHGQSTYRRTWMVSAVAKRLQPRSWRYSRGKIQGT